MKLNLDKIRTDGGTQPRATLNEEMCREYAEAMAAGETFPAIEVYFDGEHYWLADGFHRLSAHRTARPGDPIECTVFQGTLQEAQWHSYGVNKTHGLRRSNRDKERAVKAALSHPKAESLSNRQIAVHCGVNEKTIRKYRHQSDVTAEIPQSPSESAESIDTESGVYRTGRDGRTINTAKIGKNRGKSGSSGNRPREIRISRNAHSLKRGHSDPCPMIPLQFSPRNPKTAAATICQHFSRSFIESLISELNERLSTEGVSE